MKQKYTYETIAGVTYPVANFSSIPSNVPSFQKWDECYLCGFPFPEGELTYFQGHGYCRKNGCDKDLKQLQEKGRGGR
jgi:hypothetical protein